MSIFPKRAMRNSTVTIHWNLMLPAGLESAVCPFVRIGINTPDGKTHLLFEEHVLLLPSTAAPAPTALQQADGYQYLNKHTPLLVVASYLSGKQSRERLAEILTNIQNGRHYYFSWHATADAAPGKYTLLSEMYIDGVLKHSGTAAEDFFYVEQLDVVAHAGGDVIIHNPGPEPVPAKLISYISGQYQRPEGLDVFYIAPGESRSVDTSGKSVFLVYNEERITIPLHAFQQPRAVRNQQYLSLRKEEKGEAVTYVLPREGDNAWRLTGVQREIWESADTLCSVAALRAKDCVAYDEMINLRLITEIL
jgi:hypothetical protein